MDFSFSEEQTLLRNSLSRYLAENYSFEDWRKFTASSEGRDPAHWRQFAELGLFAAPLPEEFGGLGGGPVESMVIMEEFGRALVVEPFIPTVVIAGGLLAQSGGALAEEMLPEDRGRRNHHRLRLRRAAGPLQSCGHHHRGQETGRRLCAQWPEKRGLGAPWADRLIVTARTGGGQREEKGVSVFLVDKSAQAACRHAITRR